MKPSYIDIVENRQCEAAIRTGVIETNPAPALCASPDSFR
jgi:hypothetical protein